MIKISEIKKNPSNPRVIRDAKFERLKTSIREFPQMLELRPIVIDENAMILGGNMRFAAIKALGMKEIPNSWVKRACDLTEQQKQEFVVKDNASFGEWDFDQLANEWDAQSLADWGLDLPKAFDEPEKEKPGEPEIINAQIITCPNCRHEFSVLKEKNKNTGE